MTIYYELLNYFINVCFTEFLYVLWIYQCKKYIRY